MTANPNERVESVARKVVVGPAKCGHHFHTDCACCQHAYEWTRSELHNQQAEIERLRTRAEQALVDQGMAIVEVPPPFNRGDECPASYDGQCHVDTSMESGPYNCFHCERPM